MPLLKYAYIVVYKQFSSNSASTYHLLCFYFASTFLRLCLYRASTTLYLTGVVLSVYDVQTCLLHASLEEKTGISLENSLENFEVYSD